MRNAHKCLKIPILQWWRKWKSDLESTHRSALPPKVNHFLRVTSCPCLPSLVDVRFCTCQLSCLQNDRQNDHITSALLAEVTIRGILPTEDAFNSSNAHPVDDVMCQSKWNSFWCWQDATLLKCYTKVNVNHLCSATIDQYVLHMSVAKTKNVSNWTQTAQRIHALSQKLPLFSTQSVRIKFPV